MADIHTTARYALVEANWHAAIVQRALDGFLEIIPRQRVDVFDVPGAFELPLTDRDIALSRKYVAIAAAALVVDGDSASISGRRAAPGLFRRTLPSEGSGSG